MRGLVLRRESLVRRGGLDHVGEVRHDEYIYEEERKNEASCRKGQANRSRFVRIILTAVIHEAILRNANGLYSKEAGRHVVYIAFVQGGVRQKCCTL